jgi:hypothetical protein
MAPPLTAMDLRNIRERVHAWNGGRGDTPGGADEPRYFNESDHRDRRATRHCRGRPHHRQPRRHASLKGLKLI